MTKKAQKGKEIRKVAVDVGYGLLKAFDGSDKAVLNAGYKAVSYKGAVVDELALMQKNDVVGVSVSGAYYIVGVEPDEVRKDRWIDPLVNAVLVGAVIYPLVKGDDRAELLILAPVEYARRKKSLMDALKTDEVLPSVRIITADGDEKEVVSVVEDYDILPQPIGLAYQSLATIPDEKEGIIVLDIGMGTADVMSFLREDENELIPEWDRPVRQTFDLSGMMLEKALAEHLGRSIKIVRRKLKKNAVQMPADLRDKVFRLISSMLDGWEKDKEEYALVIGGGGALILAFAYPDLPEEIEEELGFTTIINPSIQANVVGAWDYAFDRGGDI